jgi:hypothetical protein
MVLRRSRCKCVSARKDDGDLAAVSMEHALLLVCLGESPHPCFPHVAPSAHRRPSLVYVLPRCDCACGFSAQVLVQSY